MLVIMLVITSPMVYWHGDVSSSCLVLKKLKEIYFSNERFKEFFRWKLSVSNLWNFFSTSWGDSPLLLKKNVEGSGRFFKTVYISLTVRSIARVLFSGRH